jgi:hypothetical protein
MWFFLAMQQTGPSSDVQISLLPKVSEYLSLIMTLIQRTGRQAFRRIAVEIDFRHTPIGRN